ncbi:MAG: RNA polymerase sigma factor [Armatimonadota bacterium]
MQELRDEDLMLLTKEGDEKAFNILVRRHRGPVLNFIYRYIGDQEAAQDLSQDVFVRLWSSAKTYVPSARFTTFLYHITRNLCRDYMDKFRRRPNLTSLDAHIDAGGNVRTLAEELPDPTPDPQEALITSELEAKIQAAIDTLSEEQKLVFILTEIHGLPYREVAKIAECPVGTVASRKSAALKVLRDKLLPLQDCSEVTHGLQ